MTDSKSPSEKPPAGTIGWIDLTTENADEICEFYKSVVGWASEAVPVKDHHDYTITPAGGSEPVAGICHKLPPNENVPGGWMIYIHVDDLEASLENCTKRGGEKLGDVREMAGYGKFCAIRDPGGSVCTLFESA